MNLLKSSRIALAVVASLSLFSTAADARFLFFGHKKQVAQINTQAPANASAYSGNQAPQAVTAQANYAAGSQAGLTPKQLKEQQWQAKQQHHKLKLHLPFFYMGAF